MSSYFFPSFFRLAAQYTFMRWDCFLRAAADIPSLRFLAGADMEATGATAAAAKEFFGGRPRLLMGPWRASIARLSLSRSATSSARMFSVIRGDRSTNFLTTKLNRGGGVDQGKAYPLLSCEALNTYTRSARHLIVASVGPSGESMSA